MTRRDDDVAQLEAAAAQLLRGLGYQVIPPKPSPLRGHAAEIVRRYQAGASMAEIAASFGVAKQGVLALLKREGVSRRPKGRSKGIKESQPRRTRARLAAMEGATP